MTHRFVVLRLLLLATITLSASTGHAWKSSAKWSKRVVPYLVNPSNLDISNAAALAGIRWSAAAWTNQSQAGFRFQYDGGSAKTNLALDSENVVLFRNGFGTTPTTRGTTYTWIQNGNIIEADMVFWDKAVSFVLAGNSCNGQIVLENTAIHEFGHALGLDHTSKTTASMYATDSACSESRLKLDGDDITGVETLYPCASAGQCNDSNNCTVDSCKAGKCQYASVAGCCNANSDCNDKNACTTDTCKASKCQHAAVANCCTNNADCNDKNACTTDTCKANKCQHAAVTNCCTNNADCNDKNACTTDTCKANKCQYVPGGPGCVDAGAGGTGGSGSEGGAGASGSSGAGDSGAAGSAAGGGGSAAGAAGDTSSGGALSLDASVPDAATADAAAGSAGAPGEEAGCGCRLHRRSPYGSSAYALAAGLFFVFGRRRRSRSALPRFSPG